MMNYQNLGDEELLNLLYFEGDLLPREAVDECIRRGSSMVGPLAEIVSDHYCWIADLPVWWSVVHASNILGSIGGEKVIIPLLKALRFAVAYNCDWVTDSLPSIFGKIGIVAIDGLKYIALDKTSDWHTRSVAISSLAAITIHNSHTEEDIFQLIYSIFKDKEEDRDLRAMIGCTLLDFPNNEYKDGLIAFGKEEKKLREEDESYAPVFYDETVEERFYRAEKRLELYTKEWLSFYNEDEILKRQDYWESEKIAKKKRLESPKIGRNDQCACGSGKKYKKCCLNKAIMPVEELEHSLEGILSSISSKNMHYEIDAGAPAGKEAW